MQGFCLGLHFLFTPGVVLFNISVFCQLFFDLGEITFLLGNIQSGLNGFQMADLAFRILQLFF